MSLAQPVLALDIGATKMAAGFVQPDGTIERRAMILTPTSLDGDVVFAALAEIGHEVLDGQTVGALGVSCAAPMLPGGETVSPLQIFGWRNFPLRQRLLETFAVPVTIDGDAKALALAERWLGAAQGRDNFVAMVVSTGVGGGIVLDGRLLDGRLSNAGHIGHVIVEPNGRPCPCGGYGCLEAEASGTAIAAITGRPASEATPEVKQRTGTLVGRGIATVANLLDLDLALIGGSVALGFGEPFFAAAQAEIDSRCVMAFVDNAKVAPVGLGADSPLLGAAAVALQAPPYKT